MANKSIILFIIFAFTNAYSQELTEDYIKLLIKKGIITDKLCMQQTAAGVDIILRGQAYKLGYYAANEELDQFANGDSEAVAKACSSSISKYPNVKKNIQKTTIMAAQEVIKTKQGAFKKFISESDPFPTEEFNRLAKFLDNYYKRATDVQELLPEEDVNVFKEGSVKIKAIGYADGVRNTTEEYDPYIAKRLCEEADGKKANFSSGKYREEAKPLTEYFDSTVDLNSFGGSFGAHKDAFLTGWNGYDKTARDSSSDNQSAIIMSRYRNTFLAKMRADSLADKTYESISNYWSSNGAEINTNTLMIRNSDAVISDAELNPNATYMCKGFCNMRRGAKLVLDFPFSSAKETGTPFFNSVSPHFEGPTSDDQLNMNKFALRTLVREYNQYLKDHSGEEDVEEAKKFIIENVKKRSTPDTYSVTPVYADFGCPITTGGTTDSKNGCLDIHETLESFNRESLNNLLVVLSPMLHQNNFRVNRAAQYLSMSIMNPSSRRFINSLAKNLSYIVKYLGLTTGETVGYRISSKSINETKTLNDEIRTMRNRISNLFPYFSGQVDNSLTLEGDFSAAKNKWSRINLFEAGDLLSNKELLFIMLGSDKEYLEEYADKYKTYLPKQLKDLIAEHIKSNLTGLADTFKVTEDSIVKDLKERMKDNETLTINELFKLGGVNSKISVVIKKNEDVEPFIHKNLALKAPLLEYYEDLYCSKLFASGGKDCHFRKIDSYPFTALNHPSMDLNFKQSKSINYLRELLSFSQTTSNFETKYDNRPIGTLPKVFYSFNLTRKEKNSSSDNTLYSEDHARTPLNSYIEAGLLFNSDHFNTTVPTGGEEVISRFVRDKFNIKSDDLEMYYYDDLKAGKEVKVPVKRKFSEYFRPIIQWTQNAIFNSINKTSIPTIKNINKFDIKPKGIRRLNYNSESNTARYGSDYLYPLFLANDNKYISNDQITSIHHFLLKSYYRSGITALLVNEIEDSGVGTLGEDIMGLDPYDDEDFKQAKDTLYSEKYGYLDETTYNAELAKLKELLIQAFKDNEVEVANVDDYLVPYIKPSNKDSDKKDDTVDIDNLVVNKNHFVSNNMKAITYISSASLNKSKGLKELNEETIPGLYDKDINLSGFSTFTKKAFEMINFLNAYFVYDSVYWYNNFDQNGEKYSEPWFDSQGLVPTGLKKLDYQELAYVMGGGPSPSVNGAQVSTIFSFANYKDAMASILNKINDKKSSELDDGWVKWTGSHRYKKIYKRVPKNLKYIYFKPKRIQGAEMDVGGDFVSGWMHTACKTGTVFPYDEDRTSAFHYQTRYRSQRNYNKALSSYYRDYPSNDKYRHPYDDTFFIPNHPGAKLPLHNMIALKRPTSFLIKECPACGCLKKGFKNGDELNNLIKTKGIELNFTDGYYWVHFNETGDDDFSAYAEKRFDVNTSVADDREIASQYYSKKAVKDPKISVPNNSETYCLYSPLVPQSHEVGSGVARDKDNLFEDNYAMEFNGTDFFLDALNGNMDDARTTYLDDGIAYYKEQLEFFNGLKGGQNEEKREEWGYSLPQVKTRISTYTEKLAQLEKVMSDDKFVIKKFQGLDDVVTDDAQIDKIYSSCIQYLNNFPMSPAMCQDSASAQKKQLRESFNWCSSLPPGVVSALGVTEADCIQTANSIFSDGSGKPVLSTDNINACRMLSKTFTDDGKVIHYNSSTKSVEKKEPASFFNK
jgi:hypothetical protein